MIDTVYRLFWVLANSNNARAYAGWVLIVLWLFFNSLIFGIGPSEPIYSRSRIAESSTTAQSKLAERRQNLRLYGKFKTNQELGSGETVKQKKSGPDWFSGLWNTIGGWSWTMWLIAVAANIFYTLASFREEVGTVVRRLTESRAQGQATSTTTPPSARPQTGQQSGGRRGVVWSFISGSFREIIVHRILRRFLGI